MGTTTARHGKNGNWRTNGVVTDAHPDYAQWIGRPMHESGQLTWQVIETPDGPIVVPLGGAGTFRVN